jgi:hypothetical protein
MGNTRPDEVTMSRCALLGLVATLAGPAPAFALREVVVGNAPLSGYHKELLALLNVEERVYLEDGPLGSMVTAYFHGGPTAVNQALRRFAALPADKHEIHLRPAPGPALEFGKKPIPYEWVVYSPPPKGGRRGGAVESRATLTIYIPEPLPPAPADPKAVRGWIAELGSDDFKTRERAAKELTAVGPSAAALLREALRGKSSAEARDRMEKILAGMSTTLRLDVLELPAGVPVVSMDDLMTEARKGLADKDPVRRGHAAGALVEPGPPADEVLPDLEKLLKTETDANPVCGAMWAANRLGAGAKPLLPLMRAAADKADKNMAQAFRQVIDGIERAKAEPVPEAEAKKWATIRAQIKDFVAGRTEKAGK